MTTQNQSEKAPQPATSSPANADAEPEASPEIAQELTDDELRAVTGGAGGAYETTVGSATGGAGAGKIKFNEF
jgi:bacteriocin-like protein